MTPPPAITDALEEHRYLYLTTIGRKSGLRRRIEIWFTVHNHRIYLISGSGTGSGWVQNLLVNPAVEIEIGPHHWPGTASPNHTPEHPARERLAARYQHWTPDQPLSEWAATGLVVELQVDNL